MVNAVDFYHETWTTNTEMYTQSRKNEQEFVYNNIICVPITNITSTHTQYSNYFSKRALDYYIHSGWKKSVYLYTFLDYFGG